MHRKRNQVSLQTSQSISHLHLSRSIIWLMSHQHKQAPQKEKTKAVKERLIHQLNIKRNRLTNESLKVNPSQNKEIAQNGPKSNVNRVCHIWNPLTEKVNLSKIQKNPFLKTLLQMVHMLLRHCHSWSKFYSKTCRLTRRHHLAKLIEPILEDKNSKVIIAFCMFHFFSLWGCHIIFSNWDFNVKLIGRSLDQIWNCDGIQFSDRYHHGLFNLTFITLWISYLKTLNFSPKDDSFPFY